MKKGNAVAGAFLALCFTLGIGCLVQYAVSHMPSAAPLLIQTSASNGGGLRLIRTEEELRAIGSSPDGLAGHYVLAGDITLTRPWQPIGSRLRPFTGTFDGNGHVIFNMAAAGRGAGMFGFARGAVLRNVVLERASIQNSSAFPIVGAAQDTRVEGCSINATHRAAAVELAKDAAAL